MSHGTRPSQPPSIRRGLKLELLTGANGLARSQAPLGLEWKYHYRINRDCTPMDHSFRTEIMVCLSLRETIILIRAPFAVLRSNFLSFRQLMHFCINDSDKSALRGCS